MPSPPILLQEVGDSAGMIWPAQALLNSQRAVNGVGFDGASFEDFPEILRRARHQPALANELVDSSHVSPRKRERQRTG